MDPLRHLNVGLAPELWDPRSAYDFAARGYDEWPWQKVWRSVERRHILNVLKGHKIESVLDIGCGTGSLLGRVNRFSGGKSELIGLDISKEMLELAREKDRSSSIRYVQCDLLKYKLPQQHFDVVFMCRVASHVPDLRPYFAVVSKLVKPSGLFVLSDVHSSFPYEHTRLPIEGSKVPVVTHKHAPEEVVAIASEFSLSASILESYGSDELSRELRRDPTLPKSLRHGLASSEPTKFGYLIAFSLNKPPSSVEC